MARSNLVLRLCAAARAKSLALDKPEQFNSASGIGVRGSVAGTALALGNTAPMQQLGVDVSALAAQAEAPRGQDNPAVVRSESARPSCMLLPARLSRLHVAYPQACQRG